MTQNAILRYFSWSLCFYILFLFHIKVGIVAWGIGCGEENVPGVYTDMSEQACWIDWAMACQLQDKHVLQYGHECNDWLQKKQAHRFPPIRSIYKACDITWPKKSRDFTDPGYPTQTKTKQALPEKIKTKTKAQTKAPGY